jgi:hypothetical protein
MTKEFDPNAVRNPSSGLFGRNPTHQEVAEYAKDQSSIVKAINASGKGVQRMRVTYDYYDMDPASPPPMAGITDIRSMSLERAQQYCKTLMRSRPNIFRMEIKLGDYPSQRRVDNIRTRMLNSDEPRFHTELGDKIGEILADKTMLVTHLVYTVHNAEPGSFHATGEVFGTTEAEYFDDENFKPSINFEFIKTT